MFFKVQGSQQGRSRVFSGHQGKCAKHSKKVTIKKKNQDQPKTPKASSTIPITSSNNIPEIFGGCFQHAITISSTTKTN